MSEPTTTPTAEGSTRVEGHGGLLAANCLKRHGVDVVFTLSGGHLFSLYDGCVSQGVRLIDVRHEQTAVFAAEGWAKVSRRVGVAALTAGPGVTNGVSAMTGAFLSGSPVVVLGGRAPQTRWGQGSLQELDHVPIVASVTKHAETCFATTQIPAAVERAIRSATSPHRGPTFLDLPMDAVFGPASCEVAAGEADEAAPADAGDVEQIGRLLAAAERPLLMVGGDVYWEHAEHALRRLAESVRVPVFLNGLGRGTLAADHELAFSRCRSSAFKGTDLAVVVGTPLDFRLGFGHIGQAKVVHVMDTPERIATHLDLAASAGGDLASTLDGIGAAALAARRPDHEAWIETLRREEAVRREKETELLESSQSPIHPARLYGELRRRLDRDAIVIGDGGDFVSYAGKYIDTFTPGCFLDPGPYGCLGTGPGYALGARLAFPDRQVVLLLGDGAAGFSLGDLDTLARFGIRVVVVVGNNLCWGLEKHPMQQLYGYHVAAELSETARYDRVMEALGGRGEQVSRPDEIGPALERALDGAGPALINLMTDPENQYPRSSVLA